MTRSGVKHPEKVTGPLALYVEGKSMDEAGEALEKALKKKAADPLLHYLLGDIRYLEGDFDGATDCFLDAVLHASKAGGAQNDLLAQLSLSTVEVMARYVKEYDAKLGAVLDETMEDLYRDSDGAYFAAIVARVRLLRRMGKFEEAEKAGSGGGCLTSWLETGPMGNTDLMGFDIPYPPETEIPWREIYSLREGEPPTAVEKADAEACWTTLGREGIPRGGAFYAMTQLDVSKKTDVRFKLSSFDPAVVIIDGLEVLRVDRRKEILPNSRIFGVILKPGAHFVTIKISSRSSSPSFSLLWKEAAPAGASPLSGLPAASRFPDLKVVPVAPPPAGLESEMIDIPDTEISRILLADFHIVRGLVTKARELLEPLAARYPGSFSLDSRLMICDAVDTFAPYSIRMNRTKSDAQKIKKDHPSIWLSYLYLAQIERQSGRPVDAAEVIKEGMKRSTHYMGFIVELADIYDELGWAGESIEVLEKAAAALEGTCFHFRIKYTLASRFNDQEGMETHARELHACDATDRTILDILTARDKWDEALAEQKTLLAAYPDDRWLLLDTGWSAFKGGDRPFYESTLKQAMQKNPSTLAEALKLADLLAAGGSEGEAAEFFFDTIGRTDGPPSFLHQKLAVLQGVPYLFPFRRSFEEAVASFKAAGKAAYGDTPAIEVLDHVTHRLFPDGSSLTRYHSVKKLLTREGVEASGEFSVPDNAVLLKIHTIKPDGKVLEPEKIYGKPTVSYPTLEPGDFTETEWVQYLPPSSIYPGGAFLDRWYFQVPDLVLHRSEMVLIVPDDMEIDLNPRGPVPEPVVTKSQGMKIYRWEVMQSPHIMYEPNSPSLNEYLPSLQVTCRTSWDTYETWVRDLLVDTMTVTPEMRGTLDEILEGIPEKDVKKRIKAVYRWVCDEIQDDEGLLTPVSYIFSEKRGDKIKLFYSLLQAAGIPSELHVAETIYADKTPSEVPDFNRFTHFVVLTDGDWLMPVINKSYYGFLPYSVYGQETRRLFPGPGKGRIPPIDAFDDEISYDLKIKVDADGESSSTLTLVFKGPKAVISREALRNIPKAELKLQVESSYLAEIFPGATLTSLSLPDLQEPVDALTLVIEFTRPPQQGPTPGSVVIGPLLKSRIALQWTQLASRTFPLLVDDNINIKTHVELNGSGMWKIMAPPEPVTRVEAGPGIFFEQKTELSSKADSMILDRLLRIPPGRISPEEYGSFLSFAGKVDETEGGVYLLSPNFL
jgi:tetratricopeptide (TPR) repeat protein